MAKARKTRTPRWLSIFRKLWTYIGNTGIITAFAGDALSDHDLVRVMILYNLLGFVIQLICDSYFRKEDIEDFAVTHDSITG